MLHLDTESHHWNHVLEFEGYNLRYKIKLIGAEDMKKNMYIASHSFMFIYPTAGRISFFLTIDFANNKYSMPLPN